MPDIVELERRITAALDRIGKGLDRVRSTDGAPGVSGASADHAELIEELEIERATIERMVVAREKHTARIERMETRQGRMAKRIEGLAAENLRLQTLVDQLSENNAALRAGEHVDPDPEYSAQIMDLNARRQADLDELDEILAELGPMIKEGV